MRYSHLGAAASNSIYLLQQNGEEVDTGHWQGVSTEGKPDLVTRELLNLQIEAPIPLSADELADILDDPVANHERHLLNLPWAEDHFQERVGRKATNPGVEYNNWPWWTPANEEYTWALEATRTEFKFTHTYQERFWPKSAGWTNHLKPIPLKGIRYSYGDLDDVVDLLLREPHTRQATFPIFFPEDTGAVHGGRVPCTLHYHFMLRSGKLHLWYPIRSCDAVRHFYDDLYMACRLCHWTLQELMYRTLDDSNPWMDVEPGLLYFTAYSFHLHRGDQHLL